ncbi:SGNH/GDSL hydrolase family protein [Alkalihalobacterium elongatum]|uniref:SGNH/GDSL hydrolase family protein n=1 Tax=Alkalihalobacterium elongatum TaxID=2675466 RepID=UPI001C1F7C79|nr:GDSL-type esterase/lipase family protein [Alkalihalobacterium elongatum]
MKLKRLVLLLITLLLASTLFSSFALANEPTRPSLVALGDSITYGYGLGNPGSEAFPYLIGEDQLNVTNLGVPGATSADLLEALQTQPSFIQAVQNANVITLNIGSNDLLQASNFAGLVTDPTSFDPETLTMNVALAIGALNSNLQTIISTIRQQTQAPIILYTLYNPIPLENPIGPGFYALAEEMIFNTNNVIKLIGSRSHSFIADAYSPYTNQQLNYLLPYDVHPNPAGHQVLANLANQLLVPLLVPSSIELTASTSEQTSDPITIAVSASGQATDMKWLQGEKAVADFQEEGNIITDGEFQVTENGTYTVYVKNIFGYESVNLINITNIQEPPIDEEPPVEEPPIEEPPVVEEPPVDEPVLEEPPTELPVEEEETEEEAIVKKPAQNQKKAINKEKKKSETIVTPIKKNKLPNTATPMYNYMGSGILLLLLGMILLTVQRFRRKTQSL